MSGAEITIDHLLTPGYLDDLGTRSLEWIRSERAIVAGLETDLSYVRRLVQGRLDIVRAEKVRRLEGGDRDLASLVQSLPEILSDGANAPGLGRMTTVEAPGVLAPGLAEQMAAAAPESVLTQVTEVGDDELTASAERLFAFEHEVSVQRRACHAALDRLGAEMVERYRTGEASVDTLLN